MCKKQPRGYYAALARQGLLPPGPPGAYGHPRRGDDPAGRRRHHPYSAAAPPYGPPPEYMPDKADGFRGYGARPPMDGRGGYPSRGYGRMPPSRGRGHAYGSTAYSPPPPPPPPPAMGARPPPPPGALPPPTMADRYGAYPPTGHGMRDWVDDRGPPARGVSPGRPPYDAWSSSTGSRRDLRGPPPRRPGSPSLPVHGLPEYRRHSRSPSRHAPYGHEPRRRSRSPVDRHHRAPSDLDMNGYGGARLPMGRAAMCQIIVLEEIDPHFISYVEHGITRSGTITAEVYYLRSNVSLGSVVRQMLADGVRAVIFLERQHEERRRLSMQVFARTSQPFAHNVQSDEYEYITVEEAEAILRRDLDGLGAGYDPSRFPARAPPPPPVDLSANNPPPYNTAGDLNTAASTNTLADLLANLQRQGQTASNMPVANTNQLTTLLQTQPPTAPLPTAPLPTAPLPTAPLPTAPPTSEPSGTKPALDVGPLLQILKSSNLPQLSSLNLNTPRTDNVGQNVGQPYTPYGNYPR
jgi:hypothetical protein